jgi:O-antigen ligase
VLIFPFIALAAGALTWRRPAYGIASFILLDPFSFAHRLGPTTMTIPKAVIIGILIGALARKIPFRPLLNPQARPLLIGACATLLATAVSITQADFVEPAIRETIKSAEYLLLFALTAVCIADDPNPRVLSWAIAAVTGIVSLLALAQEFGGAPQVVAVGDRLIHRIAGPLEGPNQLAGYLGLTLPVLFAQALRGDSRISPGERYAYLGVFILGSSVDVLTFSRAGVASLLIGLLAVLWMLRPRMLAWTLAALSLIIAAVASRMGGPLHHFLSAREVNVPSGLGTRSQLWPAAIALWRQHPFLGIGAGNYELELSRVGLADLRTHANSLPLQAIAEGGIPLIAAVLWTIYASIVTWLQAMENPLIVGILGASIALAAHQFMDLLIFYPKVGDMWWTLLGIGVGYLVYERSCQDDARTRQG